MKEASARAEAQACERAQDRTRHTALLCGRGRFEGAGVPRPHLQWQYRTAFKDAPFPADADFSEIDLGPRAIVEARIGPRVLPSDLSSGEAAPVASGSPGNRDWLARSPATEAVLGAERSDGRNRSAGLESSNVDADPPVIGGTPQVCGIKRTHPIRRC